MAKELAIVLNNGSVNSAVATALAAQKYRPVLLHTEQGPRSGSRLRAAYDMQVAHFQSSIRHRVNRSAIREASAQRLPASAISYR